MRQPIVMDYFNKMEIQESNNEMKEYTKNIMSDNVNTLDIKEVTNNSNEIVEVIYGNETYKTWKVEFIRPLIIKFLKNKFPDSLIVREINQIDITMFDNLSINKIPIEIQRTPLITSKNKNKTFGHSEFERKIRAQIDINIENYGKCWFFMDSEYLRYLQNDNIGKNASIDLTWLIKLMKEKTLNIFAIRYDGLVKELVIKDFGFLKNISQLCQIGCDNDERILCRNKLEIYYNIINKCKFTQEEITQFEYEFDKRNNKDEHHSSRFYMKSENERCKLYGNIMNSISDLSTTNDILSCTITKNLYTTHAVTLGLFDQNEFHGFNNNARIQFVDKFDIAQYFPGYIRNKEMWDYCKKKQRVFTIPEFNNIINGTFNYEFLKKQSTMLDY